MSHLLSKTDFKLALSCPKKLTYKKLSYPTSMDSAEFAEMLVQGGFIVERYAQLLYKNGISLKATNLQLAAEKTQALLSKFETVTLFDAAFINKGKVIRTDILVKRKNILKIIEVKSKSYDSEEKRERWLSQNPELIEDVAFQRIILEELYPTYEILTYLLLPDKSKINTIEGLAGWFKIEKSNEEQFKPEVKFIFENGPQYKERLCQLRKNFLLTRVKVDKDIKKVIPELDGIQRPS